VFVAVDDAQASVTAKALEDKVFLWRLEDCISWKANGGSDGVSPREADCGLLHEHGEGAFVAIFSSLESFEKWVSIFDSRQQEVLRGSLRSVKGSELPAAIHVKTFDLSRGICEDGASLGDETLFPDAETEYFLLHATLILCKVCKYLVGLIVSCLFYDYVYVHFMNYLRLFWMELRQGSCGHTQSEQILETSTSCPYSPWCLGSWQRVLSGYGSFAQCECECGALWYSYAP